MTRLPSSFLARPIAHRGLHDRAAGVIENSLPAIRAAREAGYGVEIDLQLSSDGEAMCFHDDELDRLTAEHGRVREWSCEDLRALALKGGDGAVIPTFAEALEAAGDAPLLVEIKPQSGGTAMAALTSRASDLAARHPGPVAFMSFDPAVILWLRDHAPEPPRGLVSMDWEQAKDDGDLDAETRAALTEVRQFEEVGADFVSYRWQDLPRPRLEALKEAGAPLLCWTTTSEAEDRSARLHAGNVTFEGYRPPV